MENPLLLSTTFKETLAGVTTPLPGSNPQPVVYRMPVKQAHSGKTIVDFYAASIPAIPREVWAEKVIAGKITVDGSPVSIDTLVKAGSVTVHVSEPLTEPPVNPYIALIYVDDDILVVNKPAPLPMHACGRFSRNTLFSFLNLAFPEETFHIIHRIDANTTGVVVIGRTKHAASFISQQFQQHAVAKEYLALVEGIVEEDCFASESAISKDVSISGGRSIDHDGHEAHTEFAVLERYIERHQTLLRVQPHSGRTNQIRLHLAHIGHPIVGDHGYKDADYFNSHPLTYDADCLYLHAWKITFKHPITNQKMTCVADIPEKFPKI